jgi:hypothetical protein
MDRLPASIWNSCRAALWHPNPTPEESATPSPAFRVALTITGAATAARYIARDEAAGFKRWHTDGGPYGPADAAEFHLRALRPSLHKGPPYPRRLALARRIVARALKARP